MIQHRDPARLADVSDHFQQLAHIVRATPWLLDALRAVRDVGPPEGYLAAGGVRDTVWNWLTGRDTSNPSADIDVVYFEVCKVDQSGRYQAALFNRLRACNWEVTNQAQIHLWHRQVHGIRAAPHRNVCEGLATWPETATAVGVRLLPTDELQIIAPFGLDDLFDLVVRYNPTLAGPAVYADRIAAKRWIIRWPELRIFPALPAAFSPDAPQSAMGLDPSAATALPPSKP